MASGKLVGTVSVHSSTPSSTHRSIRETPKSRKSPKLDESDPSSMEVIVPMRSSKSVPCSSSTFRKSTSTTSTIENLTFTDEEDEIKNFIPMPGFRVRSFPNLILLQDEIGKSPPKILDEKNMKELYPTMSLNDMYYIDLQGYYFSKIEKSVLQSWKNVIGIDAGENNFQMEIFRACLSLEELIIPLNGIKHINIHSTNFNKLKMLDLTCNSVTPTAIYVLGQLINLKILDLTSNNIKSIPSGINSKSYPQLQVLILDYNFISRPATFKILSRLPKLKTLSLIGNKVSCLPFIETKGTNTIIKQQMKKLMLDAVKEDQIMQNKGKPELNIKKRQMALYIKDERNDGCPFPCLQQLDLQNNKISQVEYVLAIKTWGDINELVLTGNRILNVPSRFLSGIRKYLVPHISLTQTRFSCRLNDPNLDPFQGGGLVKRVLAHKRRCNCHSLERGKRNCDLVQFNLDVSRSTPSGISSLPLPHQRLCTFQHVSATTLGKQKLSSRGLKQLTLTKVQISDLSETILQFVAPSTLPSTIQATKVALQRVLKGMDVEMLGNFVLKDEKIIAVEEKKDVLFGKLFRKFLLEKLNCK